MKVGLFGGTFDPVHIGHVSMCVSLAESRQLDRVYILPTNANPHKKDQPLASPQDRLQMLKKAFAPLAYCKILSIELARQSPAYTIDTVEELLRKEIVKKEDQLFLLMGQDLLHNFHRWKRVEELVELIQPLIARRAEEKNEGEWQHNQTLSKSVRRGLVSTMLIDCSATVIRERLKAGLFCGHLLDNSVLKYIKKHKLYDGYGARTRS